MNVGEMLRQARLAKGLTIPKLSKATGLSNGYISMVENSDRTLSAKSMGVLMAALCLGKARREQIAARWASQKAATPREKELLRAASRAVETPSKQTATSRGDRNRAAHEIVQVVSGQGVTAQDLATIVRLLARDSRFRDLVLGVARLPEADRRRCERAFVDLLPGRGER